MERYGHVSRNARAARRRFVPFVAFFLLAALLTQANVSAAGSAAPTPPAPPSEKLLAEYGQWETEYWPDTGGLSFNYVGDPNPTAAPADKQNANPDFVISAPTLLTAIIDVHVNPNADAAQGTQAAPPGSLGLVDAVGNDYGPFAAEAATVPGRAGGVVMWVVLVDHIELPPGHYWVHDSDPSSRLGNAQTFNVGATLVKGVDAAAYAKYMDALIAVNESEPDKEGFTPTPVANTSGTQPEKISYSNPQPVVNSSPDPAVTAYPANNPSYPCAFVTDKPVMVTKIMDYHINNGKGASPKLIGLQEHGGTWYGSWPAYGQAYNNIPNSIWVVTPNFEIPAGSYKVMDNEFSTLSAGADNKAMCVVKVAPVVTSPIDNVTGKYTIDFMGDDGTAIDYPLVLAIIDHKNSLEVGMMVEGYGFKFSAPVTGRENGGVTARYSQGFGEFSLVIRMTFTKKAQGYSLSGSIIILANGQSGTVGYSGARTSTDLPGFIPKPAGGLGKLGTIPGPGSAGQAAAGIAFPTLATLIAGSLAALGGGGFGGGYGGDSGDDGGGDSSGDDGGADSGSDDGGADSGGDDGGGGDTSGYDSSGAGGADGGGGGSASDGGGGSGSGVDVAGGGSAGVTGAAAGGSTDAGPAGVSAAAPQAGPQDGQTMSVHDYGDGSDKTYVYHADTGGWINPLTGGAYVAANYATSAQDHIDTTNADNQKAKADAYALAEGPNKRLAQIAEDGRTRLRLLAEIQKTQRAIYDTPGAEGEGPVSSSDRMNKLAEGLTSGQVSIADAQALLNRQKQFNGDIHVGKAGTQSAADLAASQETSVAAVAHMGNDVVHGAYDAVTDVQGKTAAGAAVRLTAGYLTGGLSEAVYVPANIVIKGMEYMDAGDSALWAGTKAFVGEAASALAPIAALHCGGAAIKGTISLLGIKPSVTLPTTWVDNLTAVKNGASKVWNTLNTNVSELLPGAAEKAAQAAREAEALAAHNAAFRAVNTQSFNKIQDLKYAAEKGALTPEDLKPILADRETRRALQASTQTTIKNQAIDTVETQINKPALDHAQQSLTNKYANLTDPADPGYQFKQKLDDGYTVETVDFRTPRPGQPKSFNADGDISGFLVKRDAQGNIIHKVDLPAQDVMAAHSEGYAKACQVYNAETKTFNASRASAELGIDLKDPKVLTNGMSKSDLAKFGVNEDLSNVTGKLADPDKLRQLQLNKYNQAYGNGSVGTADADFGRDFSTSDSIMNPTKLTPAGAIPPSPFEAMQKSGKGGLVDPQGLAFMERNKVTTNWNQGTVRSQMEAMESLRKMGKAANDVSKGYSKLTIAANEASADVKAGGLPPLSENMQAALKIAENRGISPALRAKQIADLGLGDPVTVADKLSAYIESAKMAPGK